MQPARYHLASHYLFSSPREAVWAALRDVPDWPGWWRWLKSVQVVQDPGADGVGGRYRNRIGSPLGYGFTYETEVVETNWPATISVRSTGDLEGRGRFDLSETPAGGTELTFTWLVHTPKWWMNVLAPIGRPAFVWNHDRLMSDFGRGLARATEGSVVESSHSVLGPQDPGFFEMPEPPESGATSIAEEGSGEWQGASS